MTGRAIDACPWDLADEGVVLAAAGLAARGLDTITLAASFCAGRFLRPQD
jgi:hypothetical protein